jgi:hypothetical protein
VKLRTSGYARRGSPSIPSINALNWYSCKLLAPSRASIMRGSPPGPDQKGAYVEPSSLLGEALHYLHGQWPKLVRFLDNGTWPLDSNPVENASVPSLLQRGPGCSLTPSAARMPVPIFIRSLRPPRPTTSSPTDTSSRCPRSCLWRRPSTTTRCCCPGTSISAQSTPTYAKRFRHHAQGRDSLTAFVESAVDSGS